MLNDISYWHSRNHSRDRAQDPGKTLEQLMTVGRADEIPTETRTVVLNEAPPSGLMPQSQCLVWSRGRNKGALSRGIDARSRNSTTGRWDTSRSIDIYLT